MAKFERATAIFEVDGRRYQLGLKQLEKRQAQFAKSAKRVFGGLKSVASLGGIGAVLGGGFALGKVAGEVLDFETGLARLGIAARGTFGDLAGLRAQIGDVSRETGVSRMALLEAAGSYVALTGDAAGAGKQLEMFARVQVATGAAMGDIASSAAAMGQNLGISAENMEKAFSVLIRGGKAGAIELRDLAGLLAELAPLGARFAGGTGIEGLNSLSAALQLSRQGFGSAAEAATGLQSLMGSIVQHADKLEKAGVRVFDVGPGGVKQLRNFQEIVEAIGNSKLARDPTLLIDALGRKEAEQAFIQLTKVEGAWNGLIQEATGAKDVAEDYAAFQATSAAQISRAFEQMKLRIAEAFTPERIAKFAEVMQGVVLMVSDMVGGLEKVANLLEQWDRPSPKQIASAAAGVADDLVSRGITEDQLKRPWELDEETQLAIKGRESSVAEQMPAARRRAEVWESGAAFEEDVARAGRPAFDMEEASRVTPSVPAPASEQWRARHQKVNVQVSIDRDANLKATVDNHRSQRL